MLLWEGLLIESGPSWCSHRAVCFPSTPPLPSPLPVDAVVCRLSRAGLQRECRVSTKKQSCCGCLAPWQDNRTRRTRRERGADRGPARTKCTVQRFCRRLCHFPRSYRAAESAAFTLSMFLRNGADDDCSIVWAVEVTGCLCLRASVLMLFYFTVLFCFFQYVCSAAMSPQHKVLGPDETSQEQKRQWRNSDMCYILRPRWFPALVFVAVRLSAFHSEIKETQWAS